MLNTEYAATSEVEEAGAAVPTEKLYNEQAVALAAFLGGPLGGSYLLYKNLMAVGQEEAARPTILWGIAATVLLMGTFVFLPQEINDRIPNVAVSAVVTALFYQLAKFRQREYLVGHRQKNGVFLSKWNAFWAGLVCMLLTLFIALPFAFFIPEEDEHIKFGTTGHLIYFNPKEVSAKEARQVGYALADNDFFYPGQQEIIRVEQNKWSYKVFVPVEKAYVNEPEMLDYYRQVQHRLNSAEAGKKVQLLLFYWEGEERIEKEIN